MTLSLFSYKLENETKIANQFSGIFEGIIEDFCIFETSKNRAYKVASLETFANVSTSDIPMDLYESIITYICESGIDADTFFEMLGIYMNRTVDPRYAEQSASRDKNYRSKLNNAEQASGTPRPAAPSKLPLSDVGIRMNRSIDPRYANQGPSKSNVSQMIRTKLTPTSMNSFKQQISNGVKRAKAA